MEDGAVRTGPALREVEGWPDEAAVVGLVARAGAGDAACTAASELAEASARARRTLLANLAGAEHDLDGELGAATDEGLFDAGKSGRSLRDLALRPRGRSFVYLPAGRSRAEGEDAADAVRTRLVALMARVAERVRERRGRLLLFLSEEEGWPPAAAELVDGILLLGGSAPPAWEGPTPRVLGRFPLETPERRGGAAPDARGGDAPGPSASWRRHRRAAGLPWARIGAGVAVIGALAGGWWWLVGETAPSGGGERETAAVGAAADTVPASAEGAAATEPAAGGDAVGERGGGEVPVRESLRNAPELPYSVLIASYAQWPQARRRLDRWRDPSGPVYFVAPTRVRGGLYWRLFAGALSDRTAGEALMEDLVERGRKDEARAWDIRPVELAFLTGTAASRTDARSRVRELEERGLPAYALPATSADDTVWAVYSGGFESAGDAAELRSLLGESEIEAELVTRRGESDLR